MAESNLETLERIVTLSDGRKGLRGGMTITATAVAGSAPIIDFVASDNSLDRYDEVIDAKGWELGNYRKNPVFQNAHKYGDVIFTLGKALITEVRGEALYQRIEFATEINPMAKIAHGLYKGGFLNAVSVGFIPLEWEQGVTPGAGGQAGTAWRRKYLKQELLELSAVGIPANPNALQMGLKAGAISKDDLHELVKMLERALEAYATAKTPAANPVPNPSDDACPKCQGKVVSSCLCKTSHRTCENGHTWHWDSGVQVISNGHYQGSGRKERLFEQFDSGFGKAKDEAPGAEPNGAGGLLRTAKEIRALISGKGTG